MAKKYIDESLLNEQFQQYYLYYRDITVSLNDICQNSFLSKMVVCVIAKIDKFVIALVMCTPIVI